jgi:CRISPR-associated protein Csd1
MILHRLYELAKRENLLDDPAFEKLPVPWLISIGDDGEYLGLLDIRGETTVPAKKKGLPPKVVKDKGRLLNVPRAHGNTANKGFARYFADTLPRILPLIVDGKDQAKADASRTTFWKQIEVAAEKSGDSTLFAVRAFGRRQNEFVDRIRANIATHTPNLTDRVTFAVHGSGGCSLLDEKGPRTWYAFLFAEVNADKKSAGPEGVCQVTGLIGPIPISHSTKLQGVPGGMSVGVSLISFDKPAFGHYGLDGAANAAIGYEATEGYCRALDALLKNTLQSIKERGGRSKLVIGGTAFLFWTKEPRDTHFISLLDDPADDPMKSLFDAAQSGRNVAEILEAEPFYLLALSANSARAIVRGYLETTLPQVLRNIASWFNDLRIADTSKEYAGAANDKFPLWQLTVATAFDRESVAPDVEERLFFAALHGTSVPDSLLVACLRRLAVEGAHGLRASRMALIKLILIRKGVPVTEQLAPDEQHPAYLHGRLLAVFEQIQYAALGDVNANVVDKFFATMSSAPAMVVGRLQENARNHLRKIRGEKPGTFVSLERRLSEVISLLSAAPPPQRLSLQDQARFALGFYHEKAKRFEEAAERKAARSAADNQ